MQNPSAIELLIAEIKEEVKNKRITFTEVLEDNIMSEIQEKVEKIIASEKLKLNQPLNDIIAEVERIEKNYEGIKKLHGFSKNEILMKKNLLRLNLELSEISPQELSLKKDSIVVKGNRIIIDFSFTNTAEENEHYQIIKLKDLEDLNQLEEEKQAGSQIFQPQKFLITRLGKFNIDTMDFIQATEKLEPISHQAAYQLNQNLYLLGGKIGTQNLKNIRNLVRKDANGRFKNCSPMEFGRSCVGLGGADNFLIAAGGQRIHALSTVEKYCALTNKWERFPDLRKDRKWPGVSCFYDEQQESLDIICFCGYGKRQLRTIEKYDSEAGDWVKLHNSEIEMVHHLKAIPYKNQILVFGGYQKSDEEISIMYQFNKEGELIEKLCETTKVPIEQGSQPHFVDRRDSVFAVEEVEGKEQIFLFDGKEWTGL